MSSQDEKDAKNASESILGAPSAVLPPSSEAKQEGFSLEIEGANSLLVGSHLISPFLLSKLTSVVY